MPPLRYGFAVLLIGTSLCGCSHFYDWYACGVPCQYGPRPPLPYEQYPGCVCHSHVVTQRTPLPQAPTQATESESPNAKPIPIPNPKSP